METEEELLHELRAGSRNAGRRLYERYSGGLMAVCLRYLGGRDEARDVLQNVFVKVLTSLGHFRYQGEGSLKAWMTRITVNESITFLRHDDRLTFNDTLPDVPDAAETQPGRVPPDVLQRLIGRYHSLFDGKWDQMISEIPPGYTALYHQMPELTDTPTIAYRLPDSQRHPEFDHKIDLTTLNVSEPFRLLRGIGTDWTALQMGQPLSLDTTGSIDLTIPSATLATHADSIKLCISAVPVWPVATDRSNRFAVSVDHGKSVVCENVFKEWGREWKIQVLENRKEFVLSLPLDRQRRDHVVTLSIVDPGQIVQKITYQ